jgi:protein-tyrosine phosphatase
MAEALLRHHLLAHDVSATVSSAGLYPEGAPATADAVHVMASRGLDIAAHRSRRVDADLVSSSDLIIGMTREHVREVAVLDGTSLPRAFTLKELVRAGRNVGPRRPSEPAASWLTRVGMGRRKEALLGVGHDEEFDVEDPVGRSRAIYKQTADELDGLLAELVDLLWPHADAGERSA